MTKTLLVEGRMRREVCRGLVIAVGWWDGASDGRSGDLGKHAPELHYLVSDENKEAPVWLETKQLTSQQWFPMGPSLAAPRQPRS